MRKGDEWNPSYSFLRSQLSWGKGIPIRLFENYLSAISEAVRRLNPRFSFRDFRARMPRSIFEAGTWQDDWTPSTLSMRNSRFRFAACCLTWADREGSYVTKAYLDEILPPHVLAVHSTEGFYDLTPYEVKQAQAPNQGFQ